MRIECLFQDSSGTIWIGTHARGVVACSGGRFQNYTKRDGLSGNGVYGITEAPDGSIWLATDNGLCKGARGQFKPIEETLATRFLWGAVADLTGALWFTLERDPGEPPRVCRCDGTSVTIIPVNNDKNAMGYSVNSITVDDAGVVWCGGDGVYRLVGGSFRPFHGSGTELSDVVALSPLSGGSVVFSSGDGVYEIHDDTILRIPGFRGTVESLGRAADGRTWAATRDGDLMELSIDGQLRKIGSCGVPLWRASATDDSGRVWLGTYGFGLLCYDESRVKSTDSSRGLPADDVMGVTTVGDQVWAATSKGLASVHGAVPTTMVEEGGSYQSSEVTAVAADNGDRLWIGKRNGAIYAEADGTLVECAKAVPLRRHRVDSLVEDGAGGIWAASSFGAGVAHFRSPNDLVCYSADQENAVPARVSAMAIGPEGSIFFGSADPQDGLGVVEFDGQTFSSVEGVAVSLISAMCFDRDGRMWLGSEEGLTVYDSDFVTSFGIEDGLTSELVTSLFCDRAGRLWIGTEGGGVCVYDGSIFQSMGFERPLCNTVNDICEDESGALWLATNGGLIRRVLRSSDVTVDIAEVVADSTYLHPEEVQFPDTVGRFTISLAGSSAADRPRDLVYRFKLEGYEADWRQTRDAAVSYPKLEAGDYRFLAQAIDRDLNYSPPTELAISVVSDPRIDALNQALRSEGVQGELVGDSRAMKEVIQQITEVAWTDLTVLVLGETGTGKGLAARQIHDLSERREKPFIHVNCGSVQESLIDSELFGHERGAFTGSIARRIGKFELAQGGTIFLDEIGDLPLASQARLLRVLQERTMERLGGTQTLTVDVRVIAATNRDLAEAVRAERYRADLFYRLNVFPIRVPPLRERSEDAPHLARHFVRVFAAHLSQAEPLLDQASIEMIKSYDWPGNVRELEHTMQRAVILCHGGEITPRELGLADGKPSPETATAGRILPLAEFERQYFRRVLDHTGGVIHGERGAAKLLDMKPTTLRSRLEKLGITAKKMPTRNKSEIS